MLLIWWLLLQLLPAIQLPMSIPAPRPPSCGAWVEFPTTSHPAWETSGQGGQGLCLHCSAWWQGEVAVAVTRSEAPWANSNAPPQAESGPQAICCQSLIAVGLLNKPTPSHVTHLLAQPRMTRAFLPQHYTVCSHSACHPLGPSEAYSSVLLPRQFTHVHLIYFLFKILFFLLVFIELYLLDLGPSL